MSDQMNIARALAPEDIQPGQYVSVLHVVTEHTPPPWEREDTWRASAPVRSLRLPEEGVMPARVVEVCLPFVLIRTARGKPRMLDVRRYRLARVSDEFGRSVFEHLGAEKRAAKADAEKSE